MQYLASTAYDLYNRRMACADFRFWSLDFWYDFHPVSSKIATNVQPPKKETNGLEFENSLTNSSSSCGEGKTGKLASARANARDRCDSEL